MKCSDSERGRKRKREEEREGERVRSAFFVDHLCFMSVAKKNKDDAFVHACMIHSHSHTPDPISHTHQPLVVILSQCFNYFIIIRSVSKSTVRVLI